MKKLFLFIGVVLGSVISAFGADILHFRAYDGKILKVPHYYEYDINENPEGYY